LTEDRQDKSPEGLRHVLANRISTGNATDQSREEKICVVEEVPLMIDVEGVETYTLLCTPVDRRALAVGFLCTEGIVEQMADVRVLKECDDDPNTIRVRLVNRIPRIGDAGRNLMIVSSCGACGSENLIERIDGLPSVGNTLRIKAELLRSVHDALRTRQSLFGASGGTHAAAIYDENGEILSHAEDTGRHNALDKAIGKCLLAGIRISGRGAALTSRLSLEMVGKCARVGIELITAVSAPTTMAIDVANRCNITLCAFVREKRATVFTHSPRVICAGG
jgi:FdhD protein